LLWVESQSRSIWFFEHDLFRKVVSTFRDRALAAPLAAGLVAAAGIFHGYAYAESIFGAEPAPLYAYLAGFAIVQFAIAFAAASVFDLVHKRSGALATAGMRVAGGAMLGVAMASISGMLFPVAG
jgi:urease accessory protein